jgi:hypothetical protein
MVMTVGPRHDGAGVRGAADRKNLPDLV